jgi:hypothetical protein
MGGGTYSPQNGYAYSLDVTDPDHTGSIVTYSSRGKLSENDLDIGGAAHKKT